MAVTAVAVTTMAVTAMTIAASAVMAVRRVMLAIVVVVFRLV